DQSKIKQVLEGQAMGESGLVDSETAPEIGKLTGADSLLFGSVDPKSTQIRIVDASSGKVIGAGVIDVGAQADETAKGNSGNVPAVKKIDAAEAAQSTELMQVRQALRRLHNKKPRLLIYAVSTDQELAELASKRPGHSRAVAKLHQGLDGVRKRRVERLRMRVLELRKTNQDFNARIVEMRASAKPD
ncbi:MAG: hypothetical protein HY042_02870, partial [Spirochaetia bacterium]|nr:hypothetical protein [Spirochaetia bacterium]